MQAAALDETLAEKVCDFAKPWLIVISFTTRETILDSIRDNKRIMTTKLATSEIIGILHAAKNLDWPHSRIAEEYGVSRRYISYIVAGKRLWWVVARARIRDNAAWKGQRDGEAQ